MAGGSNSQSSSSRPATGAERADVFRAGITEFANTNPGFFKSTAMSKEDWLKANPQYQGSGGLFNMNSRAADAAYNEYAKRSLDITPPEYQRAYYNDPGAARQLSGGDYDTLQGNILQSRLAPLKQYEAEQRERLDADLAKRGIWSSGLATQAQNDLTNKLADNYQQAGNEAVAQRYQLQAQDLNSANQFALNRSSMANQFNSTEQDRLYQSKWRPAEYLSGLWNGTGGAVSSGSGGGWNFSI